MNEQISKDVAFICEQTSILYVYFWGTFNSSIFTFNSSIFVHFLLIDMLATEYHWMKALGNSGKQIVERSVYTLLWHKAEAFVL